MSVRAHPIKKIEYGGEIFNLWHDEYFMKLLEAEGFYDTLFEGTGISEIAPVMIESMEEQFEEDIRDGKVGETTIARVREIFKDLKKEMKESEKRGDGGYVSYYCF